MIAELVRFLTARLAEDEAAAQACCRPRQPAEGGEVWTVEDYVPSEPDAVQSGAWVVTGPEGEDGVGMMSSDYRAQHSARHDPARVLREVEAKRAILAEHQTGDETTEPDTTECRTCTAPSAGFSGMWPVESPCPTLRLLALPYSDHPDYQEIWRPA